MSLNGKEHVLEGRTDGDYWRTMLMKKAGIQYESLFPALLFLSMSDERRMWVERKEKSVAINRCLGTRKWPCWTDMNCSVQFTDVDAGLVHRPYTRSVCLTVVRSRFCIVETAETQRIVKLPPMEVCYANSPKTLQEHAWRVCRRITQTSFGCQVNVE